IGVVWFLLYFYPLVKKRLLPIFNIYIFMSLYLLLQLNLFGTIPIIIWITLAKYANQNSVLQR
ncbi:hypothetical protein V6C20_07650, partial [Caldibacillus thermoamylovorans]